MTTERNERLLDAWRAYQRALAWHRIRRSLEDLRLMNFDTTEPAASRDMNRDADKR